MLLFRRTYSALSSRLKRHLLSRCRQTIHSPLMVMQSHDQMIYGRVFVFVVTDLWQLLRCCGRRFSDRCRTMCSTTQTSHNLQKHKFGYSGSDYVQYRDMHINQCLFYRLLSNGQCIIASHQHCTQCDCVAQYATMSRNFVFLGVYFTLTKFYALFAHLNARKQLKDIGPTYQTVHLSKLPQANMGTDTGTSTD